MYNVNVNVNVMMLTLIFISCSHNNDGRFNCSALFDSCVIMARVKNWRIVVYIGDDDLDIGRI